MFQQILRPVADSLGLSFLVAALPIVAVLLMLGLFRRPAWQSSLLGLIVAFLLAIFVWQLPVGLAVDSVANGAVFALWPVMWIVVNALLLYNVAVASGRFDAFRDWVAEHMPNDRRAVLVVIGFCFGALLEGVAGFGTPVAITSALLVMVGYPPIEALVFTLIFNTAPVAFGALGVPITVLGAVTHLPAAALGAMVGRQLPFIAVILPFYVMTVYGGFRSVRAIWPCCWWRAAVLRSTQFVTANYIDYQLTDVLSVAGVADRDAGVLASLASGARPGVRDPRGPAGGAAGGRRGTDPGLDPLGASWRWSSSSGPTFKVAAIGQQAIPWPGLNKAISITLYNNQPYGAVWAFQPLATGTAILAGGDPDRPGSGPRRRSFLSSVAQTCAAGAHRHPDRDADHRARVSDELLRHELHARAGGRHGRRDLPADTRRSSAGWPCSCRAATPRATRCSATCRSWRPISCSSIRC